MDIAGIEARISQIEARLATGLGVGSSGGATAPPQTTFAQTLNRAAAPVPAAPVPARPLPTASAPANPLPTPPNFVSPLPVQPAPAPEVSNKGARQWENLIQKYATEFGVSPDLVRAVIDQESNGNPRAVSHAGAMGLMQLMPANVREAGVSDAFDPEQNIRAGVAQLKEHLDRYNGDLRLALAAYNAGPGNVAKYDGVPPFKETQHYVRKILGRLNNESGR